MLKKKKVWIPILSIISAIAIIISFNEQSNVMKSYDINDYEVIEIYYDDINNLREGVHTEETEGIRKQFDSYTGEYDGTLGVRLDYPTLCYADNIYTGGYKKLEVYSDRLLVSSKTSDNKYLRFGVYDGNEPFCNNEGYYKSIENDEGKKTVFRMKKFADLLMSEKKQVITDKSRLYKYTTILLDEPEKMVLDVDGKEYKGYDEIITKIEFIDQGETRLVKIDVKGMSDDDAGASIYTSSAYYKIVLKKDNSEFEKEYDEIYDEVKDVPYIDK